MDARGLWAALALVACGGGDEPEGAASANQIERLSTPQVGTQDPQAAARLLPLTAEHVGREGLLGAGCEFSGDGAMLLAAVGGDAIVRTQEGVRRLVASAPVGPTGGFFEDGEVSVSVGRTDEAARTIGESTAWPARITVTNRRAEAQQEAAGMWTCGA